MVRNLRATLIVMLVLIPVSALGIVLFSANVTGLSLFISLWGLAFGGVPVA